MTFDPLPPDAPPLYWHAGDGDPSIVGHSTGAVFLRATDGHLARPEGRLTQTLREQLDRKLLSIDDALRANLESLESKADTTAPLERLAVDLGAVDDRAFADADSFWPSVLEQVEEGLP